MKRVGAPRLGGGKRTSERGAAFIELLVSIVLLGTAGIAVLTALGVAIQGARIHSDISDGQNWLANIGDLIVDEDSVYLDCAANTTPAIVAAYQTAVTNLSPAGAPLIVVTDVTFWDSTATPPPPAPPLATGAFVSTCRFAQGDRLQQVSLQTTVASRTYDLVVVKRPSALPPTVTFKPPPTTLAGPVTPTPTPNL